MSNLLNSDEVWHTTEVRNIFANFAARKDDRYKAMCDAAYALYITDHEEAIDDLCERAMARGFEVEAIQRCLCKAKERAADYQMNGNRRREKDKAVFNRELDKHNAEQGPAKEPPKLLSVISAASWTDKPEPERKWIINGLLPGGEVSLLNGHGGASKTQFGLQIAVGVELKSDVCGFLVENGGPVLYVSLEETEDEMWRRTANIVRHLQRTLRDVPGLHFYCRPDDPEYIAWVNPKTGLVERTSFYDDLEMTVKNGKYVLVVMENVAQLFGGSETDRTTVQRFVSVGRRLAMRTGAAVLLLQHVSIYGKNSGDSTSGSTQWHNAVRSRFSIETPRLDKQDGDLPELDNIRILKGHKLNYGKKSNEIRLMVDETGYLRPESFGPTIQNLVAYAEAEAIFLKRLDDLAAQGRRVCTSQGKSYAPNEFVKGNDAAKKIGKLALERAMERLFEAGKIKTALNPDMKPSRAGMVIVRTNK